MFLLDSWWPLVWGANDFEAPPLVLIHPTPFTHTLTHRCFWYEGHLRLLHQIVVHYVYFVCFQLGDSITGLVTRSSTTRQACFWNCLVWVPSRSPIYQRDCLIARSPLERRSTLWPSSWNTAQCMQFTFYYILNDIDMYWHVCRDMGSNQVGR